MTDPSTTAVSPPRFALGDGQAAFDAACERARDESWANRLFDRDTTLWSDGSRGPGGDRRAARLAGRARTTSRTGSPASRGSATGSWPPDSATAIVAGMGGSSLAPDVLHRTFGSQDGYLALRILDSTDPAYVTADRRRSRSADDPHDRRLEVGHDDRAERVPRRRLDPRRGRDGRPQAPPLVRQRRRDDRGGHGPGQERRGARPPRRLPRGLPEPARHRRPLLRADVRRARAGVAHRPRPRRAPGLGDHDARRVPPARSVGQPGRVAGPGDRDPREGGPRQAHVPHRRRDSRASAAGWSSSSRRAPASTASGSCPSTWSRSATSGLRDRIAPSSGSP